MKIWDEKTIAYAAKTENICDSYLMYLTGHTTSQWFTSLTKSPLNNRTDYKSIDTRYRSVTIELKNRSISIDAFDTLMIETEKFSALCQTGNTTELTDKSWYINFMDNSCEKFWIVDIKSIMHKKIGYNPKAKIKIPELGEKYTYYAARYYINKYYGHYYELNKLTNKYVQIW